MRGWQDLNPQPSGSKPDALSVELQPHSGLGGGIRTPNPLLPKQVRFTLRHAQILGVDDGARTRTPGATIPCPAD